MEKGDIIADGFATEMGELPGQRSSRFHALGGYNFEDSIWISERVSKRIFTKYSYSRV